MTARSLVAADAAVLVARVPNDGIKPSACVDGDGTLHLVYFKGPAAGGDAYYVNTKDGGTSFSAPIRVNSQDGSVLGVSSIRGPQLACGRGGIVHVVWNGSNNALPKGPLNPGMPSDSKANGAPLLYTRFDPAQQHFEPQRNLLQQSCSLDGGSAVAADANGGVNVVWHAEPKSGGDESTRVIWMATSRDDGAHFAEERNILPGTAGVCGCCSLAVRAGTGGTIAILARAANEGGGQRPMNLLLSVDGGSAFIRRALDEWPLNACPMSSASIATTERGFAIAWEGKNKVEAARFDLAAARTESKSFLSLVRTSSGKALKYPVVAVNRAGDLLFAWTIGMGWSSGGSMAWELYHPGDDTPVAKGAQDGVPASDCLAAVALPDGRFLVVY